MVHSGVAFAPERVVHDILDSTAFNVAMFAMGWAATRRWTVKGNEPAFGLNWFKAFAGIPLALLPPTRDPPGSSVVKDVPPLNSVTEAALVVEPFQAAENDEYAPLLAGLTYLLSCRVVSADASSELPPWRRSCFHNKRSLDMSMDDYMAHIHWFFECSTPCLVLALVYLDRALSGSTKLVFTPETCHRMMLASLLLAVKFHDDETPYSSAFYADVGRVSVEELNAMEKQFCKSIDWQFHVTPEDYIRYRDLITTAASPVPAA